MLVWFQKDNGEVVSKDVHNRLDSDFIFIAEQSENQGILYASTVENTLNKYQKNRKDEIQAIELYQRKKEMHFMVHMDNGEQFELTNQKFALLLLTYKGGYQAISKLGRMDNLLIFNLPGFLGNGINHFCFLSDEKENKGMMFFWLIKECFSYDGTEFEDSLEKEI